MRIRQLGSTVDNAEIRQHLTTFVINDFLAIDAGCLGLLSPVAKQRQIKHVFLSHTHFDHVATLPIFLDNVFQGDNHCPTIHASQVVWESLSRDVFNERLWPDLARLATSQFRFFNKVEIASEIPVQIGQLTITPVSVDHTVPTLGFLIEDDYSAIVIASDTGPTERIWELSRQAAFRKKLRMVFLECSFPDNHEWLAYESKHLCTRLFSQEIAKVPQEPPFDTVAVHLKAMMNDQIRAELNSLNLPRLSIGGQDNTWDL